MPLTAPVRLVDRRDDCLRVRAEQVMGTVASLHLHDPEVPESAVDAAFEHLHDIDRRFSVFREDSEIRRLERGLLAECDARADVREVLAVCERLRESTGGVFDIRRHRGPRTLDPSGYVKGWAAEAAAGILLAAGARTFYLGVGGDVVAYGEPEPGRAWRVGIRHPDRTDATAAVLAIRDLAVATSGLYERGDHIRDARTGTTPDDLLSVTIVATSLAQADVCATIAFAMGRDGIGWTARQPGCEVFAITSDRRVTWTPGLRDLLVEPAQPNPGVAPGDFAANQEGP